MGVPITGTALRDMHYCFLPIFVFCISQPLMAYQQLPSGEHGSSSYPDPGLAAAAFPPGYDDLHEGSYRTAGYQNYAYMNVETAVQQSFHIDTDLPPAFGRFETVEEQEKAPNLLLRADHTQAVVNLRGSRKAVIDFGQGSYYRRVLEIVGLCPDCPDVVSSLC